VRIPYIRLAKGLPTEAAQRQAIKAAGLSDEDLAGAYVDRAKLKPGEMSAWAYMMGAVRTEGAEVGEVWIARPAIIAGAEMQARLIELTEQGGVLVVASTGRRHRWHPDAAEALTLAADIRADERALVMAKARAAGAVLGRQNYPPEQWKRAKALWVDPTKTAEQAAAESGIGMRSLYRKYGPKGTPAFGRKGKWRAK
jgi:hypothetical protein